MPQPIVLAFDTSGPHCATALVRGDEVLATHHEEMAKGQAERLMPLIQQTLDDAGIGLRDLDAVGVGVGPGNFTGIRISVAAARGLALALGVPAIGVTAFDALYGGRLKTLSSIVALPAPRGAYYVKHVSPSEGEPVLIGEGDTAGFLPSGGVDLLVTPPGHDLPAWLRHCARDWGVGPPIALSIARIAARRAGTPQPRPAPLYVKPADAAPSRELGPQIL